MFECMWQVIDFMLVSGGSLGQGRHANAVLCTGLINFYSCQQLDAGALEAIVTELHDAVHKKSANRPWQSIAEEASTRACHGISAAKNPSLTSADCKRLPSLLHLAEVQWS